MSGKATQLLFSPGGSFDGSTVAYSVAAGAVADVYAGWLSRSTPTRGLRADARTYASARRTVVGFWGSRLAGRAEYVVPEKRVLDAELAVQVQQIALGWRYSAGNTYEELSFAEAVDAAEVMAGYGYDDLAKEILRVTLRALPGRFTNWRAGEQFAASALYYRLYRDRRFVEEQTPALARLVRVLARQIEHGTDGGLLEREQYSTDIGRAVYGLHGQAVVREGLFAMSRVVGADRAPEAGGAESHDRGPARREPPAGRSEVDEAPARRVALRAGRASRRGQAVRSPDRLA